MAKAHEIRDTLARVRDVFADLVSKKRIPADYKLSTDKQKNLLKKNYSSKSPCFR